MSGGTLIISRNTNCHGWIKEQFEQMGFSNVEITGEEKDSLNTVIEEAKPRLAVIGSGFYQAGTPYMAGKILKRFPKLNMAAVSVCDYPLSLAPWFIWHGVKSYVSFWEGPDEFYRGLREVREGGRYISPVVRELLDLFPDWPETRDRVTKRQMEVLIHLCAGFVPERIGEKLHIALKTVFRHLQDLYDTFHVSGREEMVSLAWTLELVTPGDMRFYAPERRKAALPQWAVVKLKIHKELYMRGLYDRQDKKR